ncbi:hypothetical protein Y032_0925g3060 [Ancylostoma ceylanicum]|nr:hypothetical protein Y032_0925g3060 [Ancylostoma ceylanicum]
MAIAQRLVETLPRIPNVIQSQMKGKPEELREMISHMLGDGLISQLVVNPLGVAEGMGVPLSTLGINKTDVESKMLTGHANSTALDLFPLTLGRQFQHAPNQETAADAENPIASAPAPFVQSLDPEVDEVVTSLRTGNVMNVERVRQLQNILQTYEQGLQTKELIAKRKQLQLLQDELVQQRKRIEEQKRMEEELRKKEQELEQQRRTMEIQLREQLNMWHNSFSNPKVNSLVFSIQQ